MWTPSGDVKLAHWPMNLLTNGGLALGAASLLPTDSSFIPPEQIKMPGRQANHLSDIWSAGLALLKLIKPNIKLSDNSSRLAFCDTVDEVLDIIEGRLCDSDVPDSNVWNQFFSRSLEPDPEHRASLEDLYRIIDCQEPVLSFDPLSRPIKVNQFEIDQANVEKLDISEIYYLWRLSLGRNFESERKQDDCPPIFKIPFLIVCEKLYNDMDSGDIKLKNYIIVSTKPKSISLDLFKTDITRLDERLFSPLILTDEEMMARENPYSSAGQSPSSGSLVMISGNECNNQISKQHKPSIDSFTFADLENLSSKSINTNIQAQLIRDNLKLQPVVIKEANFAYQCERIILFKRLLVGCPYLKDQLRREASIDIPPYYRARTWAIILDIVPEKSVKLYETIDKTTPIATDRQISVDIPRCHQYNELMASPQGHEKLARILKAWLNYNSSEYVYWQGLDSLAAPFLLLNFDNEAIAFACFNAFVSKYLKGFFKKDNQLVVQQYLSMFSELLSYHDSSLAAHLEKLGFLPNLYAIPWFLTMFTHVLPLHKILHIWDCLLLGDEKFPLCIGLAILNQLRNDLMNYCFNDCIVAFSDLPEIDIEKCIKDASHFYNSTPDKLIDLKTSSNLVNL